MVISPLTNASVKPQLERIETDIAEIKNMIQNANGKLVEEPVDCLCNDTKKVLKEKEENENEEQEKTG